MKTFIKQHWLDLLFLLGITAVLMIPYLGMDLLPIEHDTFFHVSRIEQLSRSISEGNWFPAIYPYENYGFGYSSPLFYSDVLLIPAALLHLAGVPLTICYKISVIAATFVSGCAMWHLALKISQKRSLAWLGAAAYIFANYRITDIYVRGALGEVFAMMFLPMLLEGLYVILWQKEKKWNMLAIGLTGLALSHDLTFLMGVVLCILLFAVKVKELTKEIFVTLCKGVGTAFLLTAFFTLPMIEQLLSQKYVLNYGTDLGAGAMQLWQFFVNKTVFGMSGYNLTPDNTMTMNVGWFLTFAPLLFLLFDHKKKEHPFVLTLCIIGYTAMLLPSSIIPWSSLTFLRFMQFPWRLSTIAMLCLAVPSAYGILSLCSKKWFTPIILACLIGEGIYHVAPVFTRTFGMTSAMTWSDILNGAIIDPCYKATYIRVELAGADYLPQNAPDYRTYGTTIKDETETSLDISYTKTGTKMIFEVSDETASSFVLPLTYYKGYQVARVNDDGSIEYINTYKTYDGMVACDNIGSGTYVCWYENTWIRKISMNISLVTAVMLALSAFWKKKKIDHHACKRSSH
jgi:hypothetical protein